jgi:hypothetical protein
MEQAGDAALVLVVGQHMRHVFLCVLCGCGRWKVFLRTDWACVKHHHTTLRDVCRPSTSHLEAGVCRQGWVCTLFAS